MTTKDLKFVQDIYKGKDERNDKYYLNIKAIDDDGSQIILLDHINNPGATGAKLLQNLTNRIKHDYSELLIEEYRAFSPGSAGAVEAVQAHHVNLRNNKPMKPNQDLFNMFGGFQGFVSFTSEQARTKGQIDAYQDRLDELKEQKAQLLSKVGNYEAENKKLESEIRNKEDKIREIKWQYEDKIRDLNNEHDKELRKYKGQSAIINAGVQGLGGFLMKKLNVSGADLAGFLGLDTGGVEHEQSQTQNTDSTDSEVKQKADIIYGWLLKTDQLVMTKVFAIFNTISSSEENLNDFYEMCSNEVEI